MYILVLYYDLPPVINVRYNISKYEFGLSNNMGIVFCTVFYQWQKPAITRKV